jgi:hypothetical protein
MAVSFIIFALRRRLEDTVERKGAVRLEARRISQVPVVSLTIAISTADWVIVVVAILFSTDVIVYAIAVSVNVEKELSWMIQRNDTTNIRSKRTYTHPWCLIYKAENWSRSWRTLTESFQYISFLVLGLTKPW